MIWDSARAQISTIIGGAVLTSSNRNMLHTIDTVHDCNGLRINRYSDWLRHSLKWASTTSQVALCGP